MKKRALAVAASIAAVVGISWGGVALAAIPDSGTGVFTACVPANGTLRSVFMIDKQGGASCPAGFDEKTWNQIGPAGPAGPAGATGPAGPAGALGYQVVVNTESVSHGSAVEGHAACPSGKVAIGGGGGIHDSADRLFYSAPDYDSSTGTATGWSAGIYDGNSGSGTEDLQIWAICANAS